MTPLEKRIFDYLNDSGPRACESVWDIANALYYNTMNKPSPCNGGIITAITKISYKSEYLENYIGNNDARYIFIKDKYK